MLQNRKKLQSKTVGGILLSIITGLLIFTACNNKNETPLSTVHIQNGMVSGVPSDTQGVEVFKGIPYAAAPAGSLRWRAPQPHKSWDGVLKANHFCDNCMQARLEQQANPPNVRRKSVWTKPFLIPNDSLSENCLYLNIWTGAKSSSEKRPVIVWIHGGGFQSGSGSVPLYNGSVMAKKGVVFVTINYRLGLFGFLALPELSQESKHNASGNYGLLDQIAALKWVKNNIGAFGGDPNNVTIDGQSAGAFSINYLVASPLAKGLFQRAIAESGGSMVSNYMNQTSDLKTAEQKGHKFMDKADANSLKELRQIPADRLIRIGGSFNPNIDGYVIPEKISRIFEQGKQNDVPTLTGWNVDEGTAFSIFSKPMDAEAFRKQAQQIYGDQADQFLKLYPAVTDKEALSSQYDLTRDLLFAVQNYTWANMQTKTGKSKVYFYTFDRKVPANGKMSFFGSFHSGEIAYALDNLKYLNRPWKPVDHK
ncbi:MAG TPA: carboxylesterase family protein, partial [Balneolaceae bacterium]|nr:carboxylesterase family protein [Balneolaceae bacterium]